MKWAVAKLDRQFLCFVHSHTPANIVVFFTTFGWNSKPNSKNESPATLGWVNRRETASRVVSGAGFYTSVSRHRRVQLNGNSSTERKPAQGPPRATTRPMKISVTTVQECNSFSAFSWPLCDRRKGCCFQKAEALFARVTLTSAHRRTRLVGCRDHRFRARDPCLNPHWWVSDGWLRLRASLPSSSKISWRRWHDELLTKERFERKHSWEKCTFAFLRKQRGKKRKRCFINWMILTLSHPVEMCWWISDGQAVDLGSVLKMNLKNRHQCILMNFQTDWNR